MNNRYIKISSKILITIIIFILTIGKSNSYFIFESLNFYNHFFGPLEIILFIIYFLILFVSVSFSINNFINKNKKKYIIGLIILIIIIIARISLIGLNTQSSPRIMLPQNEITENEIKIKNDYQNLLFQYNLKYKSIDESLEYLSKKIHRRIELSNIIGSFSVGNHINNYNDPYLFFIKEINYNTNDCVEGSMNLISGKVEISRDVCTIWN